MYLKYLSISDLNNIIISHLDVFPRDIDLIVGIPRSGMIPANLLALYLNKPFTDIDSFKDGRIYSSGERGKDIDSKEYCHILVVDDSIDSGFALEKAKKEVAFLEDRYSIKYAAIIATTNSKKLVDYYCEIIDEMRVFQWNLFHHKKILVKACIDIDGVLCLNPPVDDDGPIYSNYINNATPYIIPSVPVDNVVSCRLEKYRDITEKWLKDHNVVYNKLHMLDLPSKKERIKWNQHGIYKGKIYKESNDSLFIESSYYEAIDIAKVSGKPVFCVEKQMMIISNEKIKRRLYHIRVLKDKLLTKIKTIF